MEFKTENEILLNAIARAEELQLFGDTTDLLDKVANGENTENQYVLDLSTHAYILSDFLSQLEDVYESCDIATARGEQLDRIGRLVNVNRLPGIAASMVLQLTLEVALSSDIVIPAGTEVLIDPIQVDPWITYTTDSQVRITSGSVEATVTCSSDYKGLQRRVPMESVYGLEGFPDVTAYNRERSTSGRSIESDEDYRRRILLWNVKNQVGTQAAFEAYLGEMEGLDDYKLIPRPEGLVGYLNIVCDCNESRLEEIQNAVQENCMLFTDDPVYCINPEMTQLDLSVSAMITREPIQHTVTEIIEMIRHEVEVWVDGGVTRTGETIHGRRIGESFLPSQLIMHLHNLFPELLSITVGTEETVAEDDEKFYSGLVTVEIT